MPVALRPWTYEDLDRLVYLADNPAIAANMTDAFPAPYTREAGLLFLEKAVNQQPPLLLAMTSGAWLAGGIGLHPRNDIYRLNAELGYWLGQEYWGYGIMTEAIRQMVMYGFANTGITRIFATPFPHNIASQRALINNGFVLEARFENALTKHGVVMDELVYSIRRPFGV
jgi:RimJ/RimL family protein N-acetyltransferase